MSRFQLLGYFLGPLILLTMACGLSDRVADEVGNQIDETIEDQVSDAVATFESGELAEEFNSLIDEATGDSLAEMIEEFAGGEWTREDVPLPPNSEVLAASVGKAQGDIALLEAPMPLDEAESWMLENLGEEGWIQGDTQISIGESRAYEFSKGQEGLALVMTGQDAGEKTHISITVFPSE